MKYVFPDFFDDFKCIADKCRHSCCVNWEIDIDSDTLEYYNDMPDEIGETVRSCISYAGAPHFELTEDKRCPFLRGDGLCRLICSVGEDALCDICREHPRFYNCYSDREEAGLGLCCEEAARLLLFGCESMSYRMFDDGEEEESCLCEEELLSLRDKLFEIIRDRGLSLSDRMDKLFELVNAPAIPGDMGFWAEFMLSLERLEDAWTDKLLLLKEKGSGLPSSKTMDEICYERLLDYFVYRHFASAESSKKAVQLLRFCVLSVRLIAALDELSGFNIENTRLYSSEIEYSDENIELILAKMSSIS